MHNPFVPESLEGWSVLHLMYRVRWDRLRSKSPVDIQRMADEANRVLAVPDAGATAAVQMLGHKGDLMFICFRRDFSCAERPYREKPSSRNRSNAQRWINNVHGFDQANSGVMPTTDPTTLSKLVPGNRGRPVPINSNTRCRSSR